jgi:hypothetical protein
MLDDERVRAAVHDVLMAGQDARRVTQLVADDRVQGQRVLTQVMADYVTELNRALTSASGRMYGVDASTFMRQYDTLWQAKLSL